MIAGIGITPGANSNYITDHAVFEATHGTAPKYADLDKVNPGSVILSGKVMLRYRGWTEAAGAIIKHLSAVACKKPGASRAFCIPDGALPSTPGCVGAGTAWMH